MCITVKKCNGSGHAIQKPMSLYYKQKIYLYRFSSIKFYFIHVERSVFLFSFSSEVFNKHIGIMNLLAKANVPLNNTMYETQASGIA